MKAISVLVSGLPDDPSRYPTIKAVAACREVYALRDEIVGTLDVDEVNDTGETTPPEKPERRIISPEELERQTIEEWIADYDAEPGYGPVDKGGTTDNAA